MVTKPREPEKVDDTTLRLKGIGPTCPGCGGPTYAVIDDTASRPWWCKECNVRLDSDGNYGNAATFPARNDPEQ
jgi:hypothetical protein